jgi:hypothetical protein
MVRKLQGLLWAIGMVSGMAASAAAQRAFEKVERA